MKNAHSRGENIFDEREETFINERKAGPVVKSSKKKWHEDSSFDALIDEHLRVSRGGELLSLSMAFIKELLDPPGFSPILDTVRTPEASVTSSSSESSYDMFDCVGESSGSESRSVFNREDCGYEWTVEDFKETKLEESKVELSSTTTGSPFFLEDMQCTPRSTKPSLREFPAASLSDTSESPVSSPAASVPTSLNMDEEDVDLVDSWKALDLDLWSCPSSWWTDCELRGVDAAAVVGVEDYGTDESDYDGDREDYGDSSVYEDKDVESDGDEGGGYESMGHYASTCDGTMEEESEDEDDFMTPADASWCRLDRKIELNWTPRVEALSEQAAAANMAFHSLSRLPLAPAARFDPSMLNANLSPITFKKESEGEGTDDFQRVFEAFVLDSDCANPNANNDGSRIFSGASHMEDPEVDSVVVEVVTEPFPSN